MLFSVLVIPVALGILFGPPLIVVSLLPGVVVATFLVAAGGELSIVQCLTLPLLFGLISVFWILIGRVMQEALSIKVEAGLLEHLFPLLVAGGFSGELLRGDLFLPLFHFTAEIPALPPEVVLIYLSSVFLKWSAVVAVCGTTLVAGSAFASELAAARTRQRAIVFLRALSLPAVLLIFAFGAEFITKWWLAVTIAELG
ncbi:hypothetical protein MRY87_00265 [bacterium]|nr:hypothetical protein [bacterium]